MFRDNFRMKKATFVKLCDKLQAMRKQDTPFRPSIPLEKRIAIALYALGSSAEYRTVSSLFGVGLSTVSTIVLDFAKTVCEQLKCCISSYPPSDTEIKDTVEGFERMGFPQCFGAVGKKC